MPFRLEPLGEGPVIHINRPVVVIGRQVDCDVKIDSRKISRRHALIGPTIDGKLSATNISESNIFKVNGTPVTKSTLGNGQILHIWEFPFKVEILSDEHAQVCDANTMCESSS